MKKYLLIPILFLMPYLALAQKKSIDGFMDIPFGSDSATVKAAVLTKGGKQEYGQSQKDFLSFNGFSLTETPVQDFIVKFTNNKAYDAFFYFAYSDDNILAAYNGLVTDVTAVYGKPIEANNFDDLSNTTRIWKLKSGNIVIKTLWVSKNKNSVSITITPINQSLLLLLRYQDDSLFDLAAAK